MKKVLKVLSLVLVFALIMVPTLSMAAEGGFQPYTPSAKTVTQLSGLQSIAGYAITILQWVGYTIAIVLILWLGIQWMTAQPAKKAELKGKMWSMAIGIALLLGGVTVLRIFWNVMSDTAASITVK